MKLGFSPCRFFKNTLSDFMTLRPVGAELFNEEVRADRQTDRHGEASSRVPQFDERA